MSLEFAPTRPPAVEASSAARRGWRDTFVPLAAWTALVSVSWGALVGTNTIRGGARVIPALVLGLVIAAFAPRVSRAASWRGLLAVSFVAAAAWAVVLAAVDGFGALSAPLLSRFDYLAALPAVGSDAGAFLSGFTERIAAFPTHVQSHPPGMVLILWALGRIGLGGAGSAAALVIAAGASATAAALIALREVAGEHAARRAAPFFVLAPAAVWIATSADALYLGVSAWGVALMVVATGRAGRKADVTAAAAGLTLGAALFLSYGVVPLAAVVLAVAGARRRLRPLAVAFAAIALVAAAFAVAGFWWLDGLRATMDRYAAGAASDRPYARYLVTNLGAFAVAAGPAAAVALARLRDRKSWLLAGGALAAVALADLSGLSKGEVERIWLPFVPWVLTACVALAGRGWLALQAAAGVVVQVVLRSPW